MNKIFVNGTPRPTMGSFAIHRSKIGWEILLPTVTVLTIVMAVFIIKGAWIGLIVPASIGFFVAHTYLNTYYVIYYTGELEIHCGLLEKVIVPIGEINSVKETKELSNAPALSIDRLEIIYKTGRVLLSPNDTTKFLADLRTFNQKISVDGSAFQSSVD